VILSREEVWVRVKRNTSLEALLREKEGCVLGGDPGEYKKKPCGQESLKHWRETARDKLLEENWRSSRVGRKPRKKGRRHITKNSRKFKSRVRMKRRKESSASSPENTKGRGAKPDDESTLMSKEGRPEEGWGKTVDARN